MKLKTGSHLFFLGPTQVLWKLFIAFEAPMAGWLVSAKACHQVDLPAIAVMTLSVHRRRMLAGGHHRSDSFVFTDTEGGSLRKKSAAAVRPAMPTPGEPGAPAMPWIPFPPSPPAPGLASVIQRLLERADRERQAATRTTETSTPEPEIGFGSQRPTGGLPNV